MAPYEEIGCYLILLLSSVSCGLPDLRSQLIPFNEATGLTSSNTNITCSKDTVIVVSSIKYIHGYNQPCGMLSCPSLPSSHLDGSNDVCQNENKIRAGCYARNNCSFTAINVTRPADRCETGYMKAESISFSYGCLKSENAFGLCENGYRQVGKDTTIIFTTPSVSAAAAKISCSCELTSSSQPSLTLTRERMAQLRNYETLVYKDGTGGPSVRSQYLSGFLLKSDSINVATAKNIEIGIRGYNISGLSKAFISVESGEGITVKCNGGSESVTTASTTLGKGVVVTTEYVSTKGTTKAKTQTASPSEGSSKTLDKTTLIILVVIIVLLVAVIAGIFIFCVRRRRRQRARKHPNRITMNNNTESPLLYHSQGSPQDPSQEAEYHELEQEEGSYAQIPGENLYSDPYYQAQPVDAADPYKVTVLDDNTLPSQYNDRDGQRSTSANGCSSPSDLARNSRGSIDAYTENSTITDDHYSEPSDVRGANSIDPSQVVYDVPAEVTYAAIHKPTVELLDNPLYEASEPRR